MTEPRENGVTPARPSRSGPSRKVALLALAAAAMLVLGACDPAEPAAGRKTPIRRVLVIGDSISHGLFGTSPKVLPDLTSRMAKQGASVTLDGYPAENPLDIWPDHPRWAERMAARVAAENPDVIVIQSILFQRAEVPDRQPVYRAAVRELFDIAQSRGAHVYIVKHHTPPAAKERSQMAVAERIQMEEASTRGITRIPLDKWMGACKDPFLKDGWHLSANGQRCYADAITATVNRLRDSMR